MKIMLLDFDGVIHKYETKWVKTHIISDPPVDGAFDFIRILIDSGEFWVNIYSSRSLYPRAVAAMVEWFKKYGLEEVYLRELIFPTQKPPAFLTIDDRCFLFKGKFPSLEYIKLFKPWNKP